MSNWKTTTLGILMALAGLINLIAKLIRGEPITLNDILIVLGAFTGGGGLIAASDGSETKKMMKAMKARGMIPPEKGEERI